MYCNQFKIQCNHASKKGHCTADNSDCPVVDLDDNELDLEPEHFNEEYYDKINN